jgi:hypothetical protein
MGFEVSREDGGAVVVPLHEEWSSLHAVLRAGKCPQLQSRSAVMSYEQSGINSCRSWKMSARSSICGGGGGRLLFLGMREEMWRRAGGRELQQASIWP